MATVTAIEHDGAKTTFEAAPGDTLMEAARAHGIDGIVADCGGNMQCATCHVYVDPAWADRLPPRRESESEMLDEAAAPLEPTSRLSCQITIDESLDGLTVRIPETQY